MWQLICWSGLVVVSAKTFYEVAIRPHRIPPKMPEYPYMNIMNKEYPFKDGRTRLFGMPETHDYSKGPPSHKH